MPPHEVFVRVQLLRSDRTPWPLGRRCYGILSLRRWEVQWCTPNCPPVVAEHCGNPGNLVAPVCCGQFWPRTTILRCTRYGQLVSSQLVWVMDGSTSGLMMVAQHPGSLAPSHCLSLVTTYVSINPDPLSPCVNQITWRKIIISLLGPCLVLFSLSPTINHSEHLPPW